MWSEDLDKKIQAAVDSTSPAYDDKAWDKMEVLLDQHLPQDKKRRRIFFLFFLFLLTGASIFFFLEKKPDSSIPGQQEQLATAPANKMPVENNSKETFTPPVVSSASQPSAANSITVTEKPASIHKNKIAATPPATPHSNLTKAINGKPIQGKGRNITLQKQSIPQQEPVITAKERPADAKQAESTGAVSTPQQTTTSIETNAPVSPAISNVNTDQSSTAVIDSLPSKEEKPVGENQKAAGSTPGKWGISFSAGPDVSSVELNKTGKTKMQYGIGFSYALNQHWSLRTGFYASRKIYSADSADYHPPKSFLNYYPNLQRIDANCMVYEILVGIAYHFNNSAGNSWFASAALSTYIMKEEDYGFSYKNSWGQPQYYKRSFNNENSHLFAVLNLSGGYQHRFTDNLYLSAEPYFKLPLSGVGFGKVKLKSAGLLFTATLRPFGKTKR